MDTNVKRREWVKTVAIIFLAVLLVLTFFSKTIMNASLPEVAAQQAASGAINARIRGSGTVEASLGCRSPPFLRSVHPPTHELNGGNTNDDHQSEGLLRLVHP